MRNSNSDFTIILNPSEGSRPGNYNGGSKLSGTVYVKTNKKVDDFGLQVIFKGKETANVYKKTGRDICFFYIQLVKDHSSLDAGQYAYPFEIQLPDDLPLSMHRRDIKTFGKCEIVYEIQAETTGTWRRKTKHVIIPVSAKPGLSSSPVPHLLSKSDSMSYFNPGDKIVFAASVDDNRVRRGETVNISFGYRNRSPTRVKKGSLKLIQTIEWFAGGESQKVKRVIVKKCFPLNEGMAQRTKAQMKQIQDSNHFTHPSYSELFETVTDGKNQVTITIPDNILTSYCSNLINVTHEFVMEVKTPLFSSNPRKVIGVWIVEKNPDTDEGYKSATSSPLLPRRWDEREVIVSPVTTYPQKAN